MRLLFVGTDRGSGGTESHFITLSRAMQAEGHQVAALVYPESVIHEGLKNSQVQLYHGVFRNAFDPRGVAAVIKAIFDFKPDWIIGSYSKEYWPLSLIARLTGTRLALFKHMDFPMRLATRICIPRLAHRFIVISNFMRERFIARGIAPERIQMLYNPLDVNHFQPDPDLRTEMRAVLGFSPQDIVLGFVGAFHRDKGMFQLAEAAHQAMLEVPNLKVLWIGGGAAKKHFERRIKASELAHRHLSRPWSSDIRRYYAAMDLLAIPSISNEAFGRVSLEGQACGVPVLCSKRGGLPETLQPGITGMLVAPGDVHAWRDAIVALATQPALREQMKAQGPSWVRENFSTPVIARQMSVLLKQI